MTTAPSLQPSLADFHPEDQVFLRDYRKGLVWSESMGMGWYPVVASAEDSNYFAHYEAIENSPVGQALTKFRLDLVDQWCSGLVVDVGIGCGSFVRDRNLVRKKPTLGFDVTTDAYAWLLEKNWWTSFYGIRVPVATFWDSLEHIPDPGRALAQVSDLVFVSMPIYRDLAHVLGSKHFKPTEHVWYWTRDGFRRWMKSNGFAEVDHRLTESELGRDGIETFVFARQS